MKRIYYLLLLLIAGVVSCSQYEVEVVVTTESDSWHIDSDNIQFKNCNDADVIISIKDTLQTIDGFGACFNELGWIALSKLDSRDRSSILQQLFTPNFGANFTICRMPLGANDFSRDWYSYCEAEDDFLMSSFNIYNDLTTLIPFINSAKNYAPTLKLWASPWSPPTWMKENKHYACASTGSSVDPNYSNSLDSTKQGEEGSNQFIIEDNYLKAYALYFSKFIDKYKKQGIDISMVMPQNEFNSCQVFPSCTWTAKGLARFVGDYLGPELEGSGVNIMLGTVERASELIVDTILNHPTASKYIKGVGFQWAGKGAVSGVNSRFPDLTLYQTEQECGDGQNDWNHCQHSWELMKHYINSGVNAYMYWNIALESGGVSRWGWSQNSLVTVNEDHSYSYNHEFYLLKHVSHYVEPGAKLLDYKGIFNNLLAFRNLDGTTVIVINNDQDIERDLTFNIDGEHFSVNLKADSFTTISLR